MWWEWLCVGVVGAAVLSVVWTSLRVGISPMPSSAKARAQIVALLEAHASFPRMGVFSLDAAPRVLDVGSGWGHLTIAIARHFPNVQVVGIECSWVPWAISRLWARLAGLQSTRLHLKRGDVHEEALPPCDAVVCYLFPKGMQALQHKLEAEVPPGTLVISHTFAIPSWTPIETCVLFDLYRSPVYVYRR